MGRERIWGRNGRLEPEEGQLQTAGGRKSRDQALGNQAGLEADVNHHLSPTNKLWGTAECKEGREIQCHWLWKWRKEP